MRPERRIELLCVLFIATSIGLGIALWKERKEKEQWKCIAGGFASDKILMKNQLEIQAQEIENQTPFEKIVQDVKPRKR